MFIYPPYSTMSLLMNIFTEDEGEEVVEEAENVDEKTDRRAEKILLGEEVSSSSEEERKEAEVEGTLRNYHTDTDSDLVGSTLNVLRNDKYFMAHM